MAKIAEVRISVHHEGTTLVVMLEGQGLDNAQMHHPRKVTMEEASEIVAKMRSTLTVAVFRGLRQALSASRPKG